MPKFSWFTFAWAINEPDLFITRCHPLCMYIPAYSLASQTQPPLAWILSVSHTVCMNINYSHVCTCTGISIICKWIYWVVMCRVYRRILSRCWVLCCIATAHLYTSIFWHMGNTCVCCICCSQSWPGSSNVWWKTESLPRFLDKEKRRLVNLEYTCVCTLCLITATWRQQYERGNVLHVLYKIKVSLCTTIVLVSHPKPTPVWIAFSFLHVILGAIYQVWGWD